MSSYGRNEAVPVTILTGFLGSGKTTLLNALLKSPSLADTAVIVNEFGQVGIDHFLIEQAIENAVLLKNGCVCCTVRGDVADTLKGLWQQRASGAVPPFSRIAIETTGLADPGPVAHTLAAQASGYDCRLDGIVTTVDAVHGEGQLRRQDEARKQVALADRIFMTKVDLTSPERAASLTFSLRALNPSAPIRQVEHGMVGADAVFGIGPEAGAPERMSAWLQAAEHPANDDRHEHGHDHGHEHAQGRDHFHHGHGVDSVVLSTDEPLDWTILRSWLDSILSLRGAQILRLKGIVRLASDRRPLVLQGIHHVLHPPKWLPRWPIEPQTAIVLIVRDVSAEGLRQSFAAMFGPA